MDYRIFIPTRGRTTSQLTVENLPKNLHDKVVLVCPKDERKALQANYPTVSVIAQPPSVTTLSRKRQWIAEHARSERVPFWFQMDDDLKFYVWQGEQHVRFNRSPALVKKFFTSTLPALISEYKVVGFGTKGFALPGGVKENYHLGFVFGMESKVALEKIEWNRIELYEDIDYTLQLLKKGERIAVTYDVVVEQRKANASGGLSRERSSDLEKRCLEKLISLHPGIVQRKPASGQHSQSNTRVSWSKAAAIGQQSRLGSLY